VARAVEALEASDVRRIILVRPAVEAGEKLGFLPGDKNPNFSPASTAGRTKMMRRTSEASKASTARATAR
jgi:phosphate starvation-inducible protein PhoH